MDIFGNTEWNGVEETFKFLSQYNPSFPYTSKEDFASYLEFQTQIYWVEKPNRTHLDWGTWGFMVYVFPKMEDFEGKTLRARVVLTSWSVNEFIEQKEKQKNQTT